MPADKNLIADLTDLRNASTTHEEDAVLTCAIKRLIELTAPPPPDSIPVRIAVVVGRDGRAGHSSCKPGTVNDGDLIECAESEVNSPMLARGFATLYIPRVQIPEVTGVVDSVAP